jgi:hypothetical protein
LEYITNNEGKLVLISGDFFGYSIQFLPQKPSNELDQSKAQLITLTPTFI